MRRRVPRGVWWALGAAALIAGVSVLTRFPWQHTLTILEDVDPAPLVAALFINLLSPLSKGWAWHLLLKPVAPNRFWVAQEANLIGAAVNNLAAGVAGEAARISLIMRRDGVPFRPALLSVAWSRGVEGLGLALFLVLAPFMLHLSRTLRGLQIGAAIALATVLVLSRFRGWRVLIAKLPASLRGGAEELAAMSWEGRLIAPTALALVSWAAEWAAYHLSLLAVHIPVTYAASFTALIAVNVGGLIRITPANVGVMQAALVGALLPFGVAADRAVAGGLALQAIEVLPILAIALGVVGLGGLRRLTAAGSEARESA